VQILSGVQKFVSCVVDFENIGAVEIMRRHRSCEVVVHPIHFTTVHGFVQIEDALNGHLYQTVASGKDYWFAVPNPKRNLVISANTTGTWIGSSVESTPLKLVVNDGTRERVALVNPFCSCRIALQVDGAFGADVGEITISWECPPRESWRCLRKSHQGDRRRPGKELESVRVKFTTVPEKLRNYCGAE